MNYFEEFRQPQIKTMNNESSRFLTRQIKVNSDLSSF